MAVNDDLVLAEIKSVRALLEQRLSAVENLVEDHESRLRRYNDSIVELRTQSGLAHLGQTAFTLIVSVVAFVAIRLLGVAR